MDKLSITERQVGKRDELYLKDLLKRAEIMKENEEYVDAHLQGRRSLRGFKKLGESGFEGYEKCLVLLVQLCSDDGKVDVEEAYAALLGSHQARTQRRSSSLHRSDTPKTSVKPTPEATSVSHSATAFNSAPNTPFFNESIVRERRAREEQRITEQEDGEEILPIAIEIQSEPELGLLEKTGHRETIVSEQSTDNAMGDERTDAMPEHIDSLGDITSSVATETPFTEVLTTISDNESVESPHEALSSGQGTPRPVPQSKEISILPGSSAFSTQRSLNTEPVSILAQQESQQGQSIQLQPSCAPPNDDHRQPNAVAEPLQHVTTVSVTQELEQSMVSRLPMHALRRRKSQVRSSRRKPCLKPTVRTSWLRR